MSNTIVMFTRGQLLLPKDKDLLINEVIRNSVLLLDDKSAIEKCKFSSDIGICQFEKYVRENVFDKSQVQMGFVLSENEDTIINEDMIKRCSKTLIDGILRYDDEDGVTIDEIPLHDLVWDVADENKKQYIYLEFSATAPDIFNRH